ncbi:MAG TPA: hypothetical protein PL090_08330 [Syntrophales bacterium]|nr:hypothetical protein [Syntrophales bacterium]
MSTQWKKAKIHDKEPADNFSAFPKICQVEPTDMDCYKRTAAFPDVGGTSVNEEVLKAGLAWHRKK